MRRTLVTGGAGFIGSHLVEALLRRGDDVRILDDLSTGTRKNLQRFDRDVEVLIGDITDPEVVSSAVKGIDTVYHLAAISSVQTSVSAPAATHAVCATGTVNLLDLACRSDVSRVVFAGSSAIYGDRATTAIAETDLPEPISPYAAAKMAAEYYCHAFHKTHGLETVSLRFFNVFGPGQSLTGEYSAVVPKFIAAMRIGDAPLIYGDGSQTRDFVYVSDVVDASILAAETAGIAGMAFNIGSGASHTVLDLVSTLNDLMKSDITPLFAAPRKGDIAVSGATISRARGLLKYAPATSFRDGLRKTIESSFD